MRIGGNHEVTVEWRLYVMTQIPQSPVAGPEFKTTPFAKGKLCSSWQQSFVWLFTQLRIIQVKESWTISADIEKHFYHKQNKSFSVIFYLDTLFKILDEVRVSCTWTRVDFLEKPQLVFSFQVTLLV